MSGSRQILKNVGALTAARGVTALLTLATTVYMARVLEPGAFGILSWALAYFAYFVLLPDLGLGVYGAREVARDHGRAPDLADHVLGMRGALALVAFAGYLGLLLTLDKPLLFKAVVAVQGLALFGHAVSLEWVYQGVERMGVLAVRNVVASALTLVGVVLLVRRPDDVVLAAAASVAALFLSNGWLFVTYWRDFRPARPRADWAVWRAMLGPALPIATAHFMVSIYTSMDQLMLGLIRTDEEVGWYAAAYRLLLAATIPSQILLQAFLPSLSTSYGDPAAMRKQGRLFASALLAFGLPLAAGGAALAPELISVFGADYAPAAGALAVLMANAAMIYINLALGNPLIAWDRERLYMYALAAGAAINIVLNFALIPGWGILGAALATLLSEVVVFTGVATFHYRVVGQLYLGPFVRTALATALSVGGALALRTLLDLGLVTTAASMAALYLAGAALFGVADPRRLVALVRPPA